MVIWRRSCARPLTIKYSWPIINFLNQRFHIFSPSLIGACTHNEYNRMIMATINANWVFHYLPLEFTFVQPPFREELYFRPVYASLYPAKIPFEVIYKLVNENQFGYGKWLSGLQTKAAFVGTSSIAIQTYVLRISQFQSGTLIVQAGGPADLLHDWMRMLL